MLNSLTAVINDKKMSHIHSNFSVFLLSQAHLGSTHFGNKPQVAAWGTAFFCASFSRFGSGSIKILFRNWQTGDVTGALWMLKIFPSLFFFVKGTFRKTRIWSAPMTFSKHHQIFSSLPINFFLVYQVKDLVYHAQRDRNHHSFQENLSIFASPADA